MAMFSYRASDATGNIIQGTLEAREERQVVAHLQQGGLIPLRINLAEAATRWQERLPLRRGRVPAREIVNFTQELAALLKAGLPLDRSLQALEHVTSRSAMQAILAQVLRDLQEGKTLGEGLSRARIFSPLYVSLVQAGETGGFLEEALDRLGDYLKTVSEFRSYLLTALIYPMILAGVGSLSLILMLLYVVPRFESFFKDMGQNLYWSTSLLIGLSHALRSYWWLGALIALGAFIGLKSLIKSCGRPVPDRSFQDEGPLSGGDEPPGGRGLFCQNPGDLAGQRRPDGIVAAGGHRLGEQPLPGQVLDGSPGQCGKRPAAFRPAQEGGHVPGTLLADDGDRRRDRASGRHAALRGGLPGK